MSLANFLHQILGFQELPDNEFAVVSSHVLSLYSASEDGYVLKRRWQCPYEYNTRAATQKSVGNVFLKEGSVGVPHRTCISFRKNISAFPGNGG